MSIQESNMIEHNRIIYPMLIRQFTSTYPTTLLGPNHENMVRQYAILASWECSSLLDAPDEQVRFTPTESTNADFFWMMTLDGNPAVDQPVLAAALERKNMLRHLAYCVRQDQSQNAHLRQMFYSQDKVNIARVHVSKVTTSNLICIYKN